MALTLNGTDGIQFNDSSLQAAAASPYVLKNRIINGGMVIDQRNAGASVTATTTAAFTYTLDRWNYLAGVSSKFSIQQNAGSVTPPAGFTNYLGVTSLAATTVGSGDYYAIGQFIEGFNTADLSWGTANAKTVTLSFQVYSSLTGTFGGAIQNSAQNRSYPFTFTVSSANTWTTVSVTIAGDTSGTWLTTNGIGMRVFFSMGMGSTYSGTAGSWAGSAYYSATGATSVVGTNGATFYITGVQLEIGTSATPFERRLYGQELMLCQRYYDAQISELGGGIASSTTNIQFASFRFTTEMRTDPTITFYGNSTANSVRSAGGSTITLNSPGVGTTTKCINYVNVSSGLTSSAFYQAGYIASAEL